jgi:hypothetical protein
MDQNFDQNPVPENVLRHELEDQVWKLRHEGKTFKVIGILMGLSAHKARYLFMAGARRQGKPPSWTDGLNDCLANSLHWLGFQGREDVIGALKSGHLQTLSSFERGLRGPAIAELTQWLGIEDELKSLPGNGRSMGSFIIETQQTQDSTRDEICIKEQRTRKAKG